GEPETRPRRKARLFEHGLPLVTGICPRNSLRLFILPLLVGIDRAAVFLRLHPMPDRDLAPLWCWGMHRLGRWRRSNRRWQALYVRHEGLLNSGPTQWRPTT